MPRTLYALERVMEISRAEWILVLDSCEVYLDESGTHDTSPLVCVAGYVFSSSQAIEFNGHWEREVKPLLPPGAEVFHANDCIGGYGKFSPLTPEQREEVVAAMVRVTKATMTLGALAAFEHESYREEIEREPRLREFVGSAYSLCALRCIELVCDWLEQENYSGDVHYIFEAGNEYAGEVSQFLSTISKTAELKRRFRLKAYGFIRKPEAPPLQSADLLGWEWRRAHEIATAEIPKHHWRLTLKSLCERPHIARHISKESMGASAIVNTFYGLRSSHQPKP